MEGAGKAWTHPNCAATRHDDEDVRTSAEAAGDQSSRGRAGVRVSSLPPPWLRIPPPQSPFPGTEPGAEE